MSATQTEISRRTVNSMYAAAIKGDAAAALAYVDDNVVVVEPPYLTYGGVYRGKVEFVRALGEIDEYLDSAGTKIESVVAEGDVVYVALQVADRKTGKPLHPVERHVVRDGKIVEVKIAYFDAGSMFVLK